MPDILQQYNIHQYPSSYSLTYKETIGVFRGARPRALAYNELIH